MRLNILILLLIFSFSKLCSQTKIEVGKLPFNIETLQSLSYKKDSIMPKFISDKFYYVNTKTNKKISKEGFEIAYPFVGRKSAIIKLNGKFGVVDRKSNLLVEPIYNTFQLWDTEFRENFVAFGTNANNVFDLLNGRFVIPGNGCAKPNPEIENLSSYKGKNGKYGINKKQKTIIEPIYDSIDLIKYSLIVARKKNKIGIIDEDNSTLLSFSYEDIVIAKPHNYYTIPNLIGLKNGNVWEYYNLGIKPILITKSKFKCQNIGEIIIKNGFGIYKIDQKFNILFYDGSSMVKEYDWISNDGTIAINENKIYILGDDGNPFLYYQVTEK